MELKVEKYDIQPIKFNFEQLKDELTKSLEKYQGLVVTEENLTDSSKMRTELNKLRTSLEDERKRVKKEWETPYKAFEVQIKELVGLVSQPIECLDKQIATYEEARKEEKRKEIQKFFDEHNENELIKLDMFFDEKWLNKTEKIEKIKETVLSTLESINKNLNVIKSQDTKYVTNMIDVYLRTLDLASAMNEKERLEKLESIARVENPTVKEAIIEPVKDDEKLYELYFGVKVTKHQMVSLKEFLTRNKIEYWKVSEE